MIEVAVTMALERYFKAASEGMIPWSEAVDVELWVKGLIAEFAECTD